MIVETRPAPNCLEVLQAAAARMLEAIAKLRADAADPDGLAAISIIDALANRTDGYERAKILESHGWSPNEAIVKILSKDSGHERIAWREAEERWVLRTGIRFPAKEGEQVTFAVQTGPQQGVYLLGTVAAVRSGLARGLIEVPPSQSGTGRYDVMAEHCVKIWRGTESHEIELVRHNVGFHSSVSDNNETN